jgi:flagellin
MSISIQTNMAAMIAANNLSSNNNFMTQTITQLTSGYRINSSGDDAAGLAVANGYAASVSELTQGVLNANQGVSQLQIIDGGLSNISTMLNRMQTLATEAASNTFTGSRTTLQTEFSTLQGEITREAANIGLGGGNSVNAAQLNVFIGGGGGATSNSEVGINLSGATVDTPGLGLGGASVSGATDGLTVGAANLNTSAPILVGGSQSFAFTLIGGAGGPGVTATVNGGSLGVTSSQAIQSLNAQLSAYGISAGLTSAGALQFQSSGTFTLAAVVAGTGTGGDLTGGAVAVPGAPTALSATDGTANAQAAIGLITAAVQALGTVQGKVGAGENDLNYGISLANSQITNISSAESSIRDADVATEAANLTKAQVLEQASVAAMAQANQTPQALLALLKS